MKAKAQKNVVVIGGGTGTFVVLRGLKNYPFNLSAIVSMSDSGGSNRRIRDEFGLLPTSDIRQCLVALSDENGGVGLLRKLFMYRFEKGKGIAGMTFGNLFMAALTDIVGSQEEAIRQTGKVLRIKGAVVPVTLTETNLYATYEDGTIVKEEHLIDEPVHDGRLRIVKANLEPAARPNPEAINAIKHADMVIIGPGDLYTSLLPNLLVSHIADALRETRGTIVYVLNLMTKFGQTYNFKASDHLRVLEDTIGKSIQYVIVNSQPLPTHALAIYAKYHERPVVNDLSKRSYYRVIEAPLINRMLYKKSSSDALIRSLIRHNSDRLAAVLAAIIGRENS
ncbi:MAG TPA: gluconeogenesis factor YvcK family protein [Patescibacteria group bacterium]|nr:gluconeogenesis factor YvcK family protein [Patescibacteria group bacterium]